MALRKSLIKYFYIISKWLGLFHLSRLLTRNGIRILGYHGFTIIDEEKFVPGLFIDPALFERRLDFLTNKKFPVLRLDDALKRLSDGTLPNCSTVITIDDGFYSVHRHAAGPLHRHDFPSTLYLTTYYFDKQTPFYDLTIDYICWKSTKSHADLSAVPVPILAEMGKVALTGARRNKIARIAKEHGATNLNQTDRCLLADSLAGCLGIDYQEMLKSRILSTLNPDEVSELLKMGMDVQLHTHRHRLPIDADQVAKEIEDNRTIIAKLTPDEKRHFCYPSGEWSPKHWTMLQAVGVDTATTCDSGFIYPDTEKFALNRILDSSRVSQIEFEAEMCGFIELTRHVRRLISKSPRGPSTIAETEPGSNRDHSRL